MAQSLAIRLENISKTFGRGKRQVHAVRNVSFTVQAGQVYGLLGPNGAGKTTLIRLLLGLLSPTNGCALIYGQDVQTHHAVLKRVGAIVEGATAYPFLSGYGNLEVMARTSGQYDRARIDALLKQVGLQERAKQRVRGYSLGMKQRLGLAEALLHDPDLLILDEPTNGLDPAGIQEFRQFARDLVDKHGKTVCVSSHMLNEVEQVCDRVAIIHKGELLREGAVAELLSLQTQVRLLVSPREKALNTLHGHWPVSADDDGALTVQASHEDIPHVVRMLVEQAIDIYEVSPQRQTLEEYFLSVTNGDVFRPEAARV
jgi:ABC-2 type transport system ATP-binding protein